jgi:group I intron endonuclease
MEKNMHIYCITNIIRNKSYIGQHAGEDLQHYLHLNCLKAFRGLELKPHLYRSIRKYGEDAFVIESLFRPTDKEEMNEAEKFLIKILGTRNTSVGYNIAEGGTGGATRCGYKNSENQKLKVSLANAGKPKSLDHRKKLSIARTGIPNPAIIESNIRRRSENPTPAALANRIYRVKKKAEAVSGGSKCD